MRLHRAFAGPIAFVLVLVLASWTTLACGSENDVEPTTADLPEGWTAAKRIDGLTQAECSGSLQNFDERLEVTPGTGSFVAQYHDGHFRCEQAVAGFVREAAAVLDILVQPVDMHPSSVAACDCLYEIVMTLAPTAPGSHDVTLYRRWDALNEPNEPVLVGSASVIVE